MTIKHITWKVQPLVQREPWEKNTKKQKPETIITLLVVVLSLLYVSYIYIYKRKKSSDYVGVNENQDCGLGEK